LVFNVKKTVISLGFDPEIYESHSSQKCYLFKVYRRKYLVGEFELNFKKVF